MPSQQEIMYLALLAGAIYGYYYYVKHPNIIKKEGYYTSPLQALGPPVYIADPWPEDTRFSRRMPAM